MLAGALLFGFGMTDKRLGTHCSSLPTVTPSWSGTMKPLQTCKPPSNKGTPARPFRLALPFIGPVLVWFVCAETRKSTPFAPRFVTIAVCNVPCAALTACPPDRASCKQV